MWSVCLVFCDCGFHSVGPLMDKDKRLMEASLLERLTMGEPGSCSDGWGYAQQIFNPILLMGWAVFPPHCLAWGQTVVGLLVVMVTSFKKTYAHTVLFSGSDPTAGHCQPMLLPETPGPSHASLVQSLMGTLLLSPGFWCPSKSVSRVLWKFCNQIPLASKIKFLGVFSPFAGSPGWEIYCRS